MCICTFSPEQLPMQLRVQEPWLWAAAVVLTLQHALYSPGELINHRELDPLSEFLIQWIWRKAQGFCTSIKFPGDAAAAVLGTTVETLVCKPGLYQQGQAHLHSNMCQPHLPSAGGSPCLQISTYWSQIKKPHHKSKIRKPSAQHFSTNWMPTYFC